MFEYLDFFVLENWYYPNAYLLTPFGNIVVQAIAYTTVLPAIIEWYWLLKTVPALNRKYSQGWKISVGKGGLFFFLFAGFGLLFLMGYAPYLFFWGLWIGCIPVLGAALSLAGVPTPFSSIRQGDWTQTILLALATFFNGFIWEFWNFGSGFFRADIVANPNYWKYDIPYVNVLHFFSEMPLLGYFGYLFFGILFLLIWLVIAYIFNLESDIEPNSYGTKK
ncbi:hypothetical protein [Hugenholtzia roseola]|uniref:hypothetical protein n=1 Tax=Hugenholtzia roseola TaxID=1002 RepID=UPI0004191B43|nr:hypothetical protein [Hugenholtzia roseola]